MAICGCGYDNKGNKTKTCRKHRGKERVSPRYNTAKALAEAAAKKKAKGRKKKKKTTTKA